MFRAAEPSAGGRGVHKISAHRAQADVLPGNRVACSSRQRRTLGHIVPPTLKTVNQRSVGTGKEGLSE